MWLDVVVCGVLVVFSIFSVLDIIKSIYLFTIIKIYKTVLPLSSFLFLFGAIIIEINPLQIDFSLPRIQPEHKKQTKRNHFFFISFLSSLYSLLLSFRYHT